MPTRSEIPIPDFFIALVLPDNDSNAFREPTVEETEQLREQTVKFWNQQLGNQYDKSTSFSFESLDLTVKNSIFGPRSDEFQQDDLDDRFNAYIEVGGKVNFSSKKTKTKSIPTGNDVFRRMVAGDSMDYLCRFVKTEGEDASLTSNNVYSTAIEVCAKRLVEDPDDHVFVVRTPTFFVALATDPFDDEEDRPPFDHEKEEFTKRTRDQIHHHVAEEYPDTLMDFTLTLVRSETGTAKPDDRFNLYFEHEATATFSADPPSQEELFAVIMRCAGTGFAGYVSSLREMDGTPFVAVTLMTIQIVGLEMPETKPLEELPPPVELNDENKKDVEEEEEKKEEQGSGDESEDDASKKKERKPPPQPPSQPPPSQKEIVTRRVPVFLALVVSAEPPAALPTPSELKDFETLILRYFYTVLKNEYPESLVDMKLKEKETKFDAGIPEPRYNMCVEYKATIRFEKENAPDEKAIKKLILHVNVGTILAHVRNLDPICFEKATEVSMRKKPMKKKSEKKKIKDAAFEAAIELLEPPSIQSSTEPPRKEESEAPPETLLEEPASDAPKMEPPKEDAATPIVLKKQEEKEAPPPEPVVEQEDDFEAPAPEPAPTVTHDPPKKKKKKKPKKEKEKKPPKDDKCPSPEVQVESDQLESQPRQVKMAEVYTAFKLNYTKEDPPEEDYEKLRKNTQDFFAKSLKKAFGSKLSEVQLQIHHKEFGAQKPDKNFNVYVEWNVETFFLSDDATQERQLVSLDRTENGDGGGDDVPTPEKLTKVLVRDINVIDYLMGAVQPIKKTAFANVTMGFMGTKTRTNTQY